MNTTVAPLPKLGDTRRQGLSDEDRRVQQKMIDGLDLSDDTPLAPACDLSGDGSCEACQ